MTAGRVAVAVVCCILLVAVGTAWIGAIRHPARLEVSTDALRYVQRNGQMSSLSRQTGDELQFVLTRRGPRIWSLRLAVAGTDSALALGPLSRHAVRQACLDRGWRFGDQVSRRRAG
jgi:hypothetical protein